MGLFYFFGSICGYIYDTGSLGWGADDEISVTVGWLGLPLNILKWEGSLYSMVRYLRHWGCVCVGDENGEFWDWRSCVGVSFWDIWVDISGVRTRGIHVRD